MPKITVVILLLAMAVSSPAQSSTPATAETPKQANSAAQVKANPDDVKSLDAILHAVYDVISGPPGERDWNRFRSLFLPQTTLATLSRKDGHTAPHVVSVDGYIALAGPYFAKNGFFENEIARRTESFGNIAHVFSTYASRHSRNEKPFERGINSIQLLNDGQRWWVLSIFWDNEHPGSSLPARYLRSPRK